MKKIIIALAASFLTAAGTFAGPIAYNTEEFRLSGGLDADSVAGTDFNIEGGYGYFFQDYTEAGLLLGYSDNDYVTSVYVGGFLEYNFDTESELIPFVGTQVRVVYADLNNTTAENIEATDPGTLEDDNQTAATLGIYAGVKYMITENLAVSAQALAEAATEDIYAEKNDVNDTDFNITLGLRYFN